MPVCSNCGGLLSETDVICSLCGAPTSKNSPPTLQGQVVKPHNQLRNWVLGGGAALAIALLTYFATASGMLAVTAPKQGNSELLQVRTPEGANPSLIQAKSEPAPLKAMMPAEVRAYLEHLRGIEEAKNKLHSKNASEAMTMASQAGAAQIPQIMSQLFGDDSPIEQPPKTAMDISQLLSDIKNEWTELRTKLNSVKPPAEVQALHDKYDEAIMQIPGTISDIMQILSDTAQGQNGQEAKKSLEKISSDSSEHIDAPLKEADKLLGQVYDRYDEKKAFDIQSDLPGGGLLSIGR